MAPEPVTAEAILEVACPTMPPLLEVPDELPLCDEELPRCDEELPVVEDELPETEDELPV